MNKEKEQQQKEDLHFQEILEILRNSSDKDDLLYALNYFRGLYQPFKDKAEVIDPIIHLLKNSKIVEIRMKAVDALGSIGKDPDEVIPVLLERLRNDRSFKVRSRIPFAAYNFRLDAFVILKEAIKMQKGNVRQNTAKTLGNMVDCKEEALALLNSELDNCQIFDEKYEFLLAIIRLEGLRSDKRKLIEHLLEDTTESSEEKDILVLKYKDVISSLERDKRLKQSKRERKEKWYKRKDFLKNLFEGISVFDKTHRCRPLQERLSFFIISLLKSRLLTLISVESLSNFPSSSLPSKIEEMLRSDIKNANELRTSSSNNRKKERRNEYSEFSEIFNYYRLIQSLSIFNLDYFINEVKFKDENKQLDQLTMDDVYSPSLMKQLNVPTTSLLSVLEEYSRETELKENFDSGLNEFIANIFDFEQDALYQEFCWLYANLEAFILDSLVFLELSYNESNKNEKTPSKKPDIIFEKQKKLITLNINDFNKIRKFSEQIDYLVETTLLSSNWIGKKDSLLKIKCGRQIRNKIIHQNGKIINSNIKNECYNSLIYNNRIRLSLSIIDEYLVVIIEFAKELYNNISNIVGKMKNKN